MNRGPGQPQLNVPEKKSHPREAPAARFPKEPHHRRAADDSLAAESRKQVTSSAWKSRGSPGKPLTPRPGGRSSRLGIEPKTPGWLVGGLQIPDGLVVRFCTSFGLVSQTRGTRENRRTLC